LSGYAVDRVRGRFYQSYTDWIGGSVSAWTRQGSRIYQPLEIKHKLRIETVVRIRNKIYDHKDD
jgi:hypothetical protein